MARADHTRKKAARANDAAYELVAPYVDAVHYRAYNPDVAAAEADPAQHFWLTGWREGRDPNAWFSTDYYLRSNPDVRASGVNPLWHFMAQGQREGRLPRPAGSAWFEELRRARPYRERPIERRHADTPALPAEALQALVRTACEAARGLVVAVSHDRYTEVPGGTQLLIADEQRKFNGDGAVYLHLSPMEARFGLAPLSSVPHELSIILDGALQGAATAGAVALALAELESRLPRLLVVHALHGHRPEAVAAIARALRPLHAFFWTHDYGAACEAPQLLRNDIAFCQAPPPDSLACTVCVHGASRPEHLARMEALFEAAPFHVLAPSPVAAAQWQRGTALPAASLRVHPHARLEPLAQAGMPPEADGPIRVAFVGHAVFRKGWTVFRDLVGAAAATGAYRFHHFASPQDLAHLAEVTGVAAETTAQHPFGMTEALSEHGIDLVLALSPWPETFGYVAHEALAAGCDVIALAGSGALAELVRATGRGLVLDDAAALLACFTGLHAAHHAIARRRDGKQRATLVHCGSTATIGRDGEADPLTTDPDLHLVANGERLDGVHRSDTWRFALQHAGDTACVRLRSRHMQPAWDRATTGDARRLGVAVTALTLDGARVENDDPRRASGWHAAEPGWQWTDGDATLLTGTAATLDVSLVRIARYWHAPLFGAAPR